MTEHLGVMVAQCAPCAHAQREKAAAPARHAQALAHSAAETMRDAGLPTVEVVRVVRQMQRRRFRAQEEIRTEEVIGRGWLVRDVFWTVDEPKGADGTYNPVHRRYDTVVWDRPSSVAARLEDEVARLKATYSGPDSIQDRHQLAPNPVLPPRVDAVSLAEAVAAATATSP